MIYFIKPVGMDGPIKIGFTCGPAKDRLRAMQTGSPFELELLCETEGSLMHEAALHRHFDYCRQRREWFAPRKELIEAIAYFSENDPDWSVLGVVNPAKKRDRPPLGGWPTYDPRSPHFDAGWRRYREGNGLSLDPYRKAANKPR